MLVSGFVGRWSCVVFTEANGHGIDIAVDGSKTGTDDRNADNSQGSSKATFIPVSSSTNID